MDELIKQLRSWYERRHQIDVDLFEEPCETTVMIKQAADTIDQLRADLASSRSEIERLSKDSERLIWICDSLFEST